MNSNYLACSCFFVVSVLTFVFLMIANDYRTKLGTHHWIYSLFCCLLLHYDPWLGGSGSPFTLDA